MKYQVLYFHEYHAAFVFTSVHIYLCNLSNLIGNMHLVLRQFLISFPGYKLFFCGISFYSLAQVHWFLSFGVITDTSEEQKAMDPSKNIYIQTCKIECIVLGVSDSLDSLDK